MSSDRTTLTSHRLEHLPVREVAGYFFLTPVWGRAYTQLYVDVVIPAQLAGGNLPAFRAHPQSRYLIYTTPADGETIRRSRSFQQLSETIATTIEFTEHHEGQPYNRMNECYRRGIALADAADGASLFLTPDIVFADGSLAAAKRLAEAGQDVVFIPAIRTLKAGVSLCLHSRFKELSAIRIAPRDLMRVALDNLHPKADASWWREGTGDLTAANLYWRAGSEGIVARCFHLHPLLVLPQRKHAAFFQSVDGDYVMAACPDSSRDYVVTDSDEILAIELSDESRPSRSYLRKGSVKDVASYAEGATNRRHRILFESTIRMHTGIHDTKAWLEAEREAELVASAVKRRLCRSTRQLVLTGDRGFFERLYRLERDRQLAVANGIAVERSNPIAQDWYAADLRPGIITNHASSWLASWRTKQQACLHAYDRIKSMTLGTNVRPRAWSVSYPYCRRLRDELGIMARTPTQVLVISQDIDSSHVHAQLCAMGHTVTTAVPAALDGSLRFMSTTTNDRIPWSTQDFIVIDRILLSGKSYASAIAEAHRRANFGRGEYWMPACAGMTLLPCVALHAVSTGCPPARA